MNYHITNTDNPVDFPKSETTQMNERIIELADKAVEDISSGSWNISDEFCIKFAELIVKECISALEEKIYRSIDNEGDEIWADLILKQHFGVEDDE